MADSKITVSERRHTRTETIRPGPPNPLRTLATMAGFALVVAGLWWGTAHPVSATLNGTAGFEELITSAAALVAWTLTAWILLIAIAAVLSTAPGRFGQAALWCADRITPAAVRHLVRATIGIATLAVPYAATVPAGATLTTPSSVACAEHTGTPDELPGVGRPQVTRPVVHDPGDHTLEHPDGPEPPPSQPEQERRPVVTVQQGDTLWDIAARHLDPDAGNPAVARESARWHAVNRDVIGHDPDLIHPGMRLHPPEP